MKILAVTALILWIGVEVFAMKPEEIDGVMNGCIQETKVEDEVIQQALQGNISKDPALKKQIACVFNKLQILNGTEIDKDKLKELLKVIAPDLSAEASKALIDKCAAEPGDTPEDKAIEVFKCSYGQ